jgi:hypothetical protein
MHRRAMPIRSLKDVHVGSVTLAVASLTSSNEQDGRHRCCQPTARCHHGRQGSFAIGSGSECRLRRSHRTDHERRQPALRTVVCACNG